MVVFLREKSDLTNDELTKMSERYMDAHGITSFRAPLVREKSGKRLSVKSQGKVREFLSFLEKLGKRQGILKI